MRHLSLKAKGRSSEGYHKNCLYKKLLPKMKMLATFWKIPTCNSYSKQMPPMQFCQCSCIFWLSFFRYSYISVTDNATAYVVQWITRSINLCDIRKTWIPDPEYVIQSKMVPLSCIYKDSYKVIGLLAGYKLPVSVCGVVWRDESTALSGC